MRSPHDGRCVTTWPRSARETESQKPQVTCPGAHSRERRERAPAPVTYLQCPAWTRGPPLSHFSPASRNPRRLAGVPVESRETRQLGYDQGLGRLVTLWTSAVPLRRSRWLRPVARLSLLVTWLSAQPQPGRTRGGPRRTGRPTRRAQGAGVGEAADLLEGPLLGHSHLDSLNISLGNVGLLSLFFPIWGSTEKAYRKRTSPRKI